MASGPTCCIETYEFGDDALLMPDVPAAQAAEKALLMLVNHSRADHGQGAHTPPPERR